MCADYFRNRRPENIIPAGFARAFKNIPVSSGTNL